jgi:predicted DCC family thiol-disulfide oxidoreductase YuxK
MTSIPQIRQPTRPILLFDDECGVCRHIAKWVLKSAQKGSGEPSIVERPIGNDPAALHLLNPDLDIWDAYETIHVVMPDGSMKLGGDAVGVVLQNLPNTKWFAWIFAIEVFGYRPFQTVLDVGYMILADVRPVLGCESCGTPSVWVRPIERVIKWARTILGAAPPSRPSDHFTGLPAHEKGIS